MAHFIGFDLREVLIDDVGGKAKNNKVNSIFIAALKSSQFVLVNKASTPTMAWST